MDDNIPFYDVKETAWHLEVSKSTIIRCIKSGKLDGHLFERGRILTSISPPKKILCIRRIYRIRAEIPLINYGIF